MSINSSTPKMIATPIGPRPDWQKTVQRREQNNQRRTRHGGHAFGREHEREHHHNLLTETHVPTHGRFGGLRHEHGSEREVKRRAVEIKRISRWHHEPDDVSRHAETFHRFHRFWQRRFAARGRECERRGLAHGSDELPQRNPSDPNHQSED